jgi:hypothetical protein
MVERPATDPAKPGSKLAEMQRLGRERGGGFRFVEPVKAVVRKVKAALSPESKPEPKPAPKPGKRGPKSKVGKPWEVEGISRPTYYRRLKDKL